MNRNIGYTTRKKKIAIIGTVGLPAKYGGFETLTDHLIRQIGDEYDICVYCSGKRYDKAERKATYSGARLKYIPLDANGIQSIPYDTLSILDALLYADVLLILGVAGAWLLPFLRIFTRKKIIISIDGLEWKRNKWSPKAKKYLRWAEKMAVTYSHADIADNESIQDYTASRYGTLSTIIEYGADHTMRVASAHGDLEQYPFLSYPYAFKVCRIEPENNIHVVLEAFAAMPEYPLVLVGNWNISDYGRQLRARYGECSNLYLLDPIYDQQRLDLLRGNAFIYVHGHSAGGTNPSLVEAMFLGLPLLSFDVSYNRTTTEDKAFYFSNAEEIIAAVSSRSVAEWKSNGARMKEVALRRYTWKHIARKYQFLIESVLSRKSKRSVRPATSLIPQAELLAFGAGHLPYERQFFEQA